MFKNFNYQLKVLKLIIFLLLKITMNSEQVSIKMLKVKQIKKKFEKNLFNLQNRKIGKKIFNNLS